MFERQQVLAQIVLTRKIVSNKLATTLVVDSTAAYKTAFMFCFNSQSFATPFHAAQLKATMHAGSFFLTVETVG